MYFPVWFNIKVKYSWTEGPKHVLYQLKLLQHQSLDIQNMVITTIKRSAWYAFSESILQTMLCSENKEERDFSVNTILEIRGEGDENVQLGDLSVRPRRTPDINTKAICLKDLIDWNGAFEPPLTRCMTTRDIKEYFFKPMIVSNWCCHTQAVESCVKKVTQA